MATKLATVGDELAEMEAWRPALIAFYRAESPWMAQTLEDLQHGRPFTADNVRVIRALMAARKAA